MNNENRENYIDQVQIMARELSKDLSDDERKATATWLMMEYQKISSEVDVIAVAGAAIQVLLHAAHQMAIASVQDPEHEVEQMQFYADALADLTIGMARGYAAKVNHGN